MGDDDDGLGLRNAGAVAAPSHDVPVVERLEVALVPDRGPVAFDEDRLEVLVAFPAFPGAVLPGGLVVAGAEPGLGRQVRRVGEVPADVRAGIGDDGSGRQRPDPGDVDQELAGEAKRLHHRLDLRVQLREHAVEVVITVQVSEASCFPSPDGMVTLCSAASTGSRSCLFPEEAFSQVMRDPSGSQPRPGPASKPRLMPSFTRAMTCPPARRIAPSIARPAPPRPQSPAHAHAAPDRIKDFAGSLAPGPWCEISHMARLTRPMNCTQRQ